MKNKWKLKRFYTKLFVFVFLIIANLTARTESSNSLFDNLFFLLVFFFFIIHITMYNLELISLRRFLQFLCFLKQFNKYVFFLSAASLFSLFYIANPIKMKTKVDEILHYLQRKGTIFSQSLKKKQNEKSLCKKTADENKEE